MNNASEEGQTTGATEDTPALARIQPSRLRRFVATGVLALLGALLILLGFLRPPATLPLQLLLIVLGAAALALSSRLYRATGGELILTAAAIRDDTGRVLCMTEDIERIERGVFAFKPSNGFTLRLNDRKPRAWAPGLWWRSGRRVGIGGAISGAEGRHMADAITAMLASRR